MKKKNNTNYKYIIVIGTLSFATLLYFVLNKKYFFVGGQGVNTDGTLTDDKMEELEKYITSHINLANELLNFYLNLKQTVSKLEKEIQFLKQNEVESQVSTLENEINNLNLLKQQDSNNKEKVQELEKEIERAKLIKKALETGEKNTEVLVDTIGIYKSNERIRNLTDINDKLQEQLSFLKEKIMQLNVNESEVRKQIPK